MGFVVSGPARADEQFPPVRKRELFSLYVVAQWYGTGVGRALLAESLGDRPAQLWVARDNARARRFYEKCGFASDGTEKVETELDGLVEIRMVR